MFADYIFSIGEEITPDIELKSSNLTTKEDIESFRGKYPITLNLNYISTTKKIFNVNSFIENNDFISFKCGFHPSSIFTVIFDKNTEEVKLFNIFDNDLIFKQDKIGLMGFFAFSDSKGAYEILDMRKYLDFKRMDKVAELDKLDQLLTLDEDSNPVIFFYEYK